MSLSRLIKITKNSDKRDNIVVIVGAVLDDERHLEVPKLRVCALKFSEQARKRILKAGGECLTFDQLAKIAPEGKNTWLVRGKKKRVALTHFRGFRGIHAKPYICNGNHGTERKYGHRTI